MKTHLFLAGTSRTACGIWAHKCKNTDSEAETALNNRIDITEEPGRETCVRYIIAARKGG